jgi:thiamine-monophosphate kinase
MCPSGWLTSVPDATARDVGEFGVIAAVVGRLGTSASVEVGPGDDAAVVLAPDGRVVATTDVLVEGVHFRLDWSSAYDVGRKAAAANLADVAAMGGTGTALLVGLAAPPDVPVAWVRSSPTACATRPPSSGRWSSAATPSRTTGRRERDGARATSAAGRRSCAPAPSRGTASCSPAGSAGRRPGSPSCSTSTPRRRAHRRPRAGPPAAHPAVRARPELARLGATAMCDVSDGLVADLGHLARASGVHVDVETRRFAREPLLGRAARVVGVHPLDFVLTGGEDHALVATVPPGRRAARRA